MQYKNEHIKNFIYHSRLYMLYAIFATIIFSWLNLNSICIIIFTALWAFEGNFKEKWILLRKDKLFLAYLLYFLVQLMGVFYASHTFEAWKYVESKLGFIVFPLIFCSTLFVDDGMKRKAITGFSIFLTFASLYCIVLATVRYRESHETRFFFYHDLVEPISQHAVYFSVYIFICLVFLLVNRRNLDWLNKRRWLQIVWVLYFIGLLILLSSKMVLTVLFLYLLFLLFKRYTLRNKGWQPLVLAAIIGLSAAITFSFDNPVKRRFQDMFNGDLTLLKKEKFNQITYFTGVDFRLLEWRFTYEILRDNHAFVIGVSPVEAQSRLQEKYRSMDMYLGEKKRNDTGYLNYNCHNQLLQCTLQSGIVGLLVFIFWIGTILSKSVKKNDLVLTAIVAIMFTFFLSESVFERQYGMILCTLIPLLFLYCQPKGTNNV
jgi:O-antigen ligase